MPGLCRLCYFVRCGAVTLPYHARLQLALPMLTQRCLAPPMPNVAWRCFTRALPRLTMPLLSIADRRLCHALLFRAYAVQYLTLLRPCNSLHLLAYAQHHHSLLILCLAMICPAPPMLGNAIQRGTWRGLCLCTAIQSLAYAITRKVPYPPLRHCPNPILMP